MKHRPFILALTLAGGFGMLLSALYAQPHSDGGWLSRVDELKRAIDRQEVAGLPERWGMNGAWSCGESRCDFVSAPRSNDDALPADLRLSLTTDVQRKTLSRAGISLDVKSQECFTLAQLQTALKTGFRRSISQPVAHCVPDFICKRQPIAYDGELHFDDGRVYELNAVADQDNCLQSMQISGHSKE